MRSSLIVFCSYPRTYFAVGTGLLFEKDRSVTLGSSMLLNFLGLLRLCLCLGICCANVSGVCSVVPPVLFHLWNSLLIYLEPIRKLAATTTS